MEVDVDYERCIGAGMCVFSAPQVFDQDDSDGTVVLLTPTPDADDDAAVRDAVLACPASALAIRG